MREAILGMENKVKDLRDKIDEIDLKILDLIQSRAIHASKIGEIKKESPDFDGVFYKPEREKVEEWLNMVANHQFTIQEIEDGLAFDTLKVQYQKDG